jgi:hypothetical protein
MSHGNTQGMLSMLSEGADGMAETRRDGVVSRRALADGRQCSLSDGTERVVRQPRGACHDRVMEGPREVEMQVAAWGPAFGYPELPVFDGEQFADQGPELPYEQRTKVNLIVAGDTSLGIVIDEAARRFGVRSQTERQISEQVHCVAWFREADEAGTDYDFDRWSAVVRTVDKAGEPSWALRWPHVTIDELLASHDAGLLDGDPLRPYFWPVIPQADIEDLVQALWTTWLRWEDILPHVLAAGATLGAAGATVRSALRVTRRARDASSSDIESWGIALQRPHEFFAFLDETPRTSADVAAVYPLSANQVEGGLPGLGYVLGPDGRWRRATDGVAGALGQAVVDIERRGRGPTTEEAAERVCALVESSETDGPGS